MYTSNSPSRWGGAAAAAAVKEWINQVKRRQRRLYSYPLVIESGKTFDIAGYFVLYNSVKAAQFGRHRLEMPTGSSFFSNFGVARKSLLLDVNLCLAGYTTNLGSFSLSLFLSLKQYPCTATTDQTRPIDERKFLQDEFLTGWVEPFPPLSGLGFWHFSLLFSQSWFSHFLVFCLFGNVVFHIITYILSW